MDEQTLEPCPFCGGPASLKADVDYRSGLPSGMWWVQCDPCDTFPESAWCKPKDEAIAAWNRRAAHSVIAMKVAELEGRIEAVRKVVEEGYPGQPAKTEQCEHGRYGWEDCVACYDAAILAALAPYPERRHD